jgi:hypothetical protein
MQGSAMETLRWKSCRSRLCIACGTHRAIAIRGKKWARDIASDTSLIISFRDSCRVSPDGFQSIDTHGFWQIPTEAQKIAMQKCRNAAMQKCRNAEIHIYENLRTSVKDHKKHCENRRKSANIYEHAERQKHGHRDMTNPINAKNTHFIELRQSINPHLFTLHVAIVGLCRLWLWCSRPRTPIESLSKIYIKSIEHPWTIYWTQT